jgi:biopolymer transport protein TolR
MSKVHQSGPARVEANFTSLIDVTFLLIVFFILVAQITSTQRVAIDLPEVEDRVAIPLTEDERLIINCLPADPYPVYRLGSDIFTGPQRLQMLTTMLRVQHQRRPNLEVALRAPRTAPYAQVHPVMEAVRDAGIERMELIVVPPEGSI